MIVKQPIIKPFSDSRTDTLREPLPMAEEIQRLHAKPGPVPKPSTVRKTTIVVRTETRDILVALKHHPKEPLDEVIYRIAKEHEQNRT